MSTVNAPHGYRVRRARSLGGHTSSESDLPSRYRRIITGKPRVCMSDWRVHKREGIERITDGFVVCVCVFFFNSFSPLWLRIHSCTRTCTIRTDWLDPREHVRRMREQQTIVSPPNEFIVLGTRGGRPVYAFHRGASWRFSTRYRGGFLWSAIWGFRSNTVARPDNISGLTVEE